jgi:hypothetical protein
MAVLSTHFLALKYAQAADAAEPTKGSAAERAGLSDR